MSSNLRTCTILLLASAGSLVSSQASGQELEGRFYLEKDSYVVGEPVLFNMELQNTGKEMIFINGKNRGDCVDSYDFEVSGSGTACSARWDPGCQDDEFGLGPGEVYKGQWPLDSWYHFEREGKYDVTATRHIPVRSSRGEIHDFTFASKFQLKLEPSDSIRVQTALQEFERNLHSSDPEIQHRALDVMATTAPTYFESTALRLCHDEDLFVVAHAVEALGRLNTPEARAALAEVLGSGKSPKESAPDRPVSDFGLVHIRAIEALGRSGDSSYQGVIERYLDDANEYVQLAAMVAIAQLGRDQAVLQLQRFLLNPDPVTRKNAVYGLRYSTAQTAIGTLIDAISDKDAQVRERALASLREVTGQAIGAAAASPESIQGEWQTWWEAHKDKFALPKLQFLCRMK
jgi:hypothetical protein